MDKIVFVLLFVCFSLDGITCLICPRNEEYDNCTLPCPPQKCSDLDPIHYQCTNVDLNPNNCVSGCRCKKNYKRNRSGSCVPIRDCPPKSCPSNESWVVCKPMPLCVDERCIRNPPLLCAYLWDGTCIPRCLCRNGYCRNESGACVKIPTCGRNEYYARSCSSPDKKCGTGGPIDDNECATGCLCQRGYVRNKSGKCVSPRNCFAD